MKNKVFLIGAMTALSLIASPAFAATSGITTTPVAPKVTTTKIDFACVQSAVDVREGTIDTAFTTWTTAESAALAARKSALHDAWGITVAKDRRVARDKAGSAFKTANRAAFSAMRSARKGAWSTFATASKACHAPVVEAAGDEAVGNLGL